MGMRLVHTADCAADASKTTRLTFSGELIRTDQWIGTTSWEAVELVTQNIDTIAND